MTNPLGFRDTMCGMDKTIAWSTDDASARCSMTVTANTNGGIDATITHIFPPKSTTCICRMGGPFAAVAKEATKYVPRANEQAEPVTPEVLEEDARYISEFGATDSSARDDRLASAAREYAAILRRRDKSADWLAVANEPATDEEIASYKAHEGCSGSCLSCLEKFRLIARIERAEAAGKVALDGLNEIVDEVMRTLATAKKVENVS